MTEIRRQAQELVKDRTISKFMQDSRVAWRVGQPKRAKWMSKDDIRKELNLGTESSLDLSSPIRLGC